MPSRSTTACESGTGFDQNSCPCAHRTPTPRRVSAPPHWGARPRRRRLPWPDRAGELPDLLEREAVEPETAVGVGYRRQLEAAAELADRLTATAAPVQLVAAGQLERLAALAAADRLSGACDAGRQLTELKGQELFRGSGRWAGVGHVDRAAARRRILEWLDERGHKVVASGLVYVRLQDARTTCPGFAGLSARTIATVHTALAA